MYCVYSPFSYSHYSWLLYWIKRLMHDGGGGGIGCGSYWMEEQMIDVDYFLHDDWFWEVLEGMIVYFNFRQIRFQNDILLHEVRKWFWEILDLNEKYLCSVSVQIRWWCVHGNIDCDESYSRIIFLHRCVKRTTFPNFLFNNRPVWQRWAVSGEPVVSAGRLLGIAG